MNFTQSDIAHLTDAEVARMVVTLNESSRGDSAVEQFWQQVGFELIRARRARRTTICTAEVELLNDDGPGAIVEEVGGDEPA